MAIQSYVSPRLEISQTFLTTATDNTPILAALIIGAQYYLSRYTVAAEKPLCAVVNPVTPSLGNIYQYQSNVTYAYPNQPINSTVDESFVGVTFDNAHAQYLPNTSLGSSGSNAAASFVTGPNSTYIPNQARFTNGSTTVLQTANGYSRSSYLSNRDVQIGDIAQITDNLNNVLITKVTGLIADTYLQNGALASSVAPVSTSGTDGVTNGTATFTSSAGAFTAAMVGQYLTIATVGTYQILSYTSATQIAINGTPASATALTYHVNGTYNDPHNVSPQSATHGSPTYAWTGSGSDPGTTNITVAASTATTSSSPTYVGYNTQRIVNDVYTATVTTAGLITAAVFTVTSQSGAFTPVTGVVANGSDIVPLDANGSNNVGFNFTGTTATLAVGQSWHISTAALVAMVEPVAAGTYTGASNIVYKLTVTRGGAFYTGSNSSTCAVLSVTSSNVDSSPNVLPVSSVAFAIGTLGVTAEFTAGSNNSGLILGDVYYVPANAAVLGAVKTIQFQDNLSQATLSTATSLTIDLREVQSGYVVNQIANVNSETYNWTTTETGITINSGITTSDPLLVSAGSPVALPITFAHIFVTFRALIPINASAIGSLNNVNQISPLLGTVDPANPLAQGMYDALLNSAGNTVYYLGVQSDDITGYNTALGIVAGSTSVYSVVPMTFNSAVQQAVVNAVDASSTPVIGRWRDAWISIPAVPTSLIYNEQSNGSNWLATVTANPLASTTQYSLVTVTGATFITDGVRPNDLVLLNFTSLPNGTVTYNSYPVSTVLTQTTLIIGTPLSAPISIAEKFQLQRNYTPTEQATNLAAIYASYDNRRARCVFPDTAVGAGVSYPGYYVAAACAGLASSLPANQGLTNQPVLGFDTLTEALVTFNSADLDILAANGGFVVTQTVLGATPYVRHQLTSAAGDSNLNTAEVSITRNVDSISYQFSALLASYIGKYNINTTSIQLIKNAIQGLLNFLQANSTSASAGPQLLPGSGIISIAQDPTFQDRLDVSLGLVVPYPLNYLTMNLIVGQSVSTSGVTTTVTTTSASGL